MMMSAHLTNRMESTLSLSSAYSIKLNGREREEHLAWVAKLARLSVCLPTAPECSKYLFTS